MAAKASSSAGGTIEGQPAPLGRADAVLGADAAAHRGRQGQHGVVGPLVVGGQAGHVDVDVAVGGVPEEPPEAAGTTSATTEGTVAMKSASAAAGRVTSSLWGAPRALMASVWASR